MVIGASTGDLAVAEICIKLGLLQPPGLSIVKVMYIYYQCIGMDISFPLIPN